MGWWPEPILVLEVGRNFKEEMPRPDAINAAMTTTRLSR
jgi:hypothetical protein